MFNNHLKTKNPDITSVFKTVLQEIFNNSLCDCTIIFSDGIHFSCLKIVLELIPCFESVFKDCFISDRIDIYEKSEVAVPIIKLIYDQSPNNLITIQNFCDILILMDKWLLDISYINLMLQYASTNIVDIVTHQLKNDNVASIVTVERLLRNINNKDYYDIFHKLYNHDFVWLTNIFMFDEWPAKFSDKHKLEAIDLSKDLKLLDKAILEPINVLNYLRIFNSENETYADVLDFAMSENTKIYYGQINFDMFNLEEVSTFDTLIHVHNYFPFFRATVLCKTKHRAKINTITNHSDITFDSGIKNYIMHTYQKLSIGSYLAINDNAYAILKNITCNYHVHGIKNNKYDIGTKAMHWTLGGNMSNYTIVFDKRVGDSGRIWKINDIVCSVRKI